MYLCPHHNMIMDKNTNYQLHLKGYVGGYDFDADYVDYILNKNSGKEVNVLIDSLGGQSNTALSIFAAFKRHGNVNVHFVGMNASAATIASLGAKRITMDASAMYLVHKCSIAFFEWGNLNADDLQTLVSNIEKQKKDLDKIDANIAQMYAARCQRTPQELLQLMKEGGWLTAEEALEWGFVDEVTDFDNQEAPVLSQSVAKAMADAGIPVPDLPMAKEQTAFGRFLTVLASIFTPYHNDENMTNSFPNICDVLGSSTLQAEGLSFDQLLVIENKLAENKRTAALQEKQLLSLQTEIQSLKEALKKHPADNTAQVVEQQKPSEGPVDHFFKTRANAKALFNIIP